MSCVNLNNDRLARTNNLCAASAYLLISNVQAAETDFLNVLGHTTCHLCSFAYGSLIYHPSPPYEATGLVAA